MEKQIRNNPQQSATGRKQFRRTEQRCVPKLLKRLAGVEGLEPPTRGLENPSPTVPPVRNHVFSCGYGTSYSGQETQFGHEYAPHYAPRPIGDNPPEFERRISEFVPVRSLLPITVSKRRLKQLDAIQLVREQRRTGRQDLAFNARPFVLCGIPLRRPPATELTYTRYNGHFLLQISGHPEFGLPFGQDRLIPIWIATLAIRQQNRVVNFTSAAQMLDFFHLPKDGPHYRRLVEGFQRIFGATIFFGADGSLDGKLLIDAARFHFFDKCAAAHLSNYVVFEVM